jgi:Na+/alanine symporter
MDHFEPYLRKRMVEAMFQSKGLAGSDSKNGIAPRAALLTACGATIGAGKLRLYLFSEAVRTFTGLL